MKKYGWLLLSVFLFASCVRMSDLSYDGIESVEVVSVGVNQSAVDLFVRASNASGTNLTVVKAELTLNRDGVRLAQAEVEEKVGDCQQEHDYYEGFNQPLNPPQQRPAIPLKKENRAEQYGRKLKARKYVNEDVKLRLVKSPEVVTENSKHDKSNDRKGRDERQYADSDLPLGPRMNNLGDCRSNDTARDKLVNVGKTRHRLNEVGKQKHDKTGQPAHVLESLIEKGARFF